MIYIASDHGGFRLKEQVIAHLKKRGLKFFDLGPQKFVPSDDYPDYAAKVAAKVSSNPKKDLGILLCRSGQGVNIVANKFRNVRAALVWSAGEAKASRTDDLANVLSLPTDYISGRLAQSIVSAWLKTPLGTNSRHVRRVQKVSQIEKKNFRNK